MSLQRNTLLQHVKLIVSLLIGVGIIAISAYVFIHYGSGRTSDIPTTIQGRLANVPEFSFSRSGEFKYPYMEFSIVGIDTVFKVESCFYKQLDEDLSRKLKAGDFLTVNFFRIGNNYYSVVGITDEAQGGLLTVSDLSTCNSSHWVLRGTMLLVIFLVLQYLYTTVAKYMNRLE